MIVLTGKSCSGKDTIAKEMEQLGYHRNITYTTRLIRFNEINDIAYHFISVEEFLKKYIDGFFLEVRYYETEFGLWFYGSSVESYRNADKNTICILTPSGLRKLFEKEIDYTGFYIDVSDDEIKNRQINRNDNKKEAERRFNEDKIDFIGIEDLVDYVIINENKETINVANEIDRLYKMEDMNERI